MISSETAHMMARYTTDRAAPQFELLRKYFTETAIGNFSRLDGAVEFYTRVNALLGQWAVGPEKVVVDFGAGRGQWFVDPTSRYGRSCAICGTESRRLSG